ncbi:peroxiredoxin [Motiliproteus sp. MSK22-1]|uniref:peroxiredoxin family protein n=1 Tax=Motiliproteus sp. MSK22-1 TaxID=1897630 RepID=UPI0009777AB9|nr:TlpA disulfide reductase family protein [Motiliproteus sp. MSK22-1]OMH38051.1 hypothetical protein BGP75_07145 [Motiliproteus sp. MSK22-1]
MSKLAVSPLISLTTLMLLAWIAIVQLVYGSESSETSIKTGINKTEDTTSKTAPNFTAPLLLQEGSVSLTDFRGKIVYLDFWASWCGPCRKSLPAMQELHTELSKSGFTVVAVNVDEVIQNAKNFAIPLALSYPLVYDGNGNIAKSFDIKAMPMSYVIDKQGKIIHAHKGYRSKDMPLIRQALMEMLKEK